MLTHSQPLHRIAQRRTALSDIVITQASEVEIEIEDVDADADTEANAGTYFTELLYLERFPLHENRYMTYLPVKYVKQALEDGTITYNVDNRLVNEDRLAHFRHLDFSMADPIILGKHVDADLYDIIDGQHRLECIRHTDKYNQDRLLIDIRIYRTPEDFHRFLDIANNRMNFDHRHLRRVKYLEVKSLLETRLRTRIWGKKRPYVIEEKFQQKLFQTRFFNRLEHSAEDVFRKLMAIHRFLADQIVRETKMKPSIKIAMDNAGIYFAMDAECTSIELLDTTSEEEFATLWASKKKSF